MMNMGNGSNPLQQMMNIGNVQQPIDKNKFQNGLANLTKNDLANIVNKARAQGMSETDIETGLNFILSLR